jgi:hypothetical protein
MHTTVRRYAASCQSGTNAGFVWPPRVLLLCVLSVFPKPEPNGLGLLGIVERLHSCELRLGVGLLLVFVLSAPDRPAFSGRL